MLLQGLTLTVVGMSVVFVFLTLLVVAMKLLSIIIPRYFPEQAGSTRTVQRSKTSGTKIEQKTVLPVSGNEEIAAAIAAVTAFTKN